MKIKITVQLKGRCFKVKSDDHLEKTTEVEAIADIFSAIEYMAKDIYAIESRVSKLSKQLKWKIDCGPIEINSDDYNLPDDLNWIERVRIIVYSIIQTVNRNRQIQKQQPVIDYCCYSGCNFIPKDFNHMNILYQNMDQDSYDNLVKQKILVECLDTIYQEVCFHSAQSKTKNNF